MPLRVRFILPLDVAGDSGRYLWMALMLRWGAPFRYPLVIASLSVALVGLHRHWCMYLTAFCLVEIEYTLVERCLVMVGGEEYSILAVSGGVELCVKLVTHKSVVGSFVPRSTSLLLYITLHS